MSGGGQRQYARDGGETGGHSGDLDRRPAFPLPSDWRRPAKARVAKIRDRLRQMYGPKTNQPHRDPVHELVLTILSQNTNDNNRDIAYGRLRDQLGDWDSIRTAPVDRVKDAIRPGGLANTKGPRIQQVLGRLGPDPNLDWLATAPREVALAYLTDLPGIGRKTAACVMIFSFDRPEIPVDTHVHRVGQRLGLFPVGISLEGAHDEVLAITERPDAFELHMNLIEHGRGPCRPKPRCGECDLVRMCIAHREGRVEPVG